MKISRLHQLIFLFLLIAVNIFASSESQCAAEDETECNSEGTEDEDEGDWDGDEWKDYILDDFWETFECNELFQSVRPIHNESTWMLLRGVYQGIVGLEESTIKPITFGNGVAVPFYVGQSPEKGRGLYAKEAVKKGTLVWHSRWTACFSDAYDYRHFLVSIPSDLACDVIQWAYVESKPSEDEVSEEAEADLEDDISGLAICVDLDEGIVINSGSYDFEDFDVFESRRDDGVDVADNIGCNPEAGKERCEDNFFALRDIDAGEEFLVSYLDFAVYDGWEKFGL